MGFFPKIGRKRINTKFKTLIINNLNNRLDFGSLFKN